MKKLIQVFLLSSILTHSFGQTKKKVITFFSAQYNKTVYHTPLNNYSWGLGVGCQSFFNNNSKFKPTIELTGDLYFDHQDITFSDSFVIDYVAYDVSRMFNLLIGSSFFPKKNIYLSFLVGPSFIKCRTLLGLKPSVGVYFSKNKKWIGKLSYINLIDLKYKREKSFASFSFSIGYTLF